MTKTMYVQIAIILVLVISCGRQTDAFDYAERDQSAVDSDLASEQSSTDESMNSRGSNEDESAVRKFSTNLGTLSGGELRNIVADVDQAEFGKGFDDGFGSKDPAYAPEKLSEELKKLEEHLGKLQEPDTTSDPYDPETEVVARLSYALGYIRGSQVFRFAPELQVKLFLASFVQSYSKEPDNMDSVRDDIQKYIEASQQKAASERGELAKTNLEKSARFLAENGEKEGVTTTTSGLQYIVLKMGEGKQPSESDSVEVHYEGKLADGSVFDSSYQRNQTATFPLNGVIAGWTEGLQYMKVGSQFRFFIPPNLGYGQQGSGNKIGPNDLLIFDVELIDIK